MSTRFACMLVVTAVALRGPVHGEIIGGVDFPQGTLSFADAVVSYLPGVVGANPTTPHRGAANAVGTPDYPGTTCVSQADCSYVSLGDGGSLILRFDDNKLTGGGNTSPDLWIFEIGPDVEDTYVDISTDGSTWAPVGKVFGATSGIDIDAFGFGTSDLFAFVRLTDDTNEGLQNGATVGADIDAVGAISTVATPIPEPSTALFLGIGVLTLLAARRAGFV